MKIRPRQKDCRACNRESIKTGASSPKQLPRVEEKYKITWNEYYEKQDKYDLIDIRKPNLFRLAHFVGSRNIPADLFTINQLNPEKMAVILCPRGISAQKIGKDILENGIDCRVVKGGLKSFKIDVDGEFPL